MQTLQKKNGKREKKKKKKRESDFFSRKLQLTMTCHYDVSGYVVLRHNVI